MEQGGKILVIRFSAMGDVAMTAPLLKKIIYKYPNIQLLVVSRGLFAPFFEGIDRLSFQPFDPRNKHKGFIGIIKLFMELKSHNVTGVANLHNNLRSNILTAIFQLCGIPSVTLDKGREEKRKLTRKHNKILVPLKTTFQRYAEVFARLGLPLNQDDISPIPTPYRGHLSLSNGLIKKIGISPFAQHVQKVYPFHLMEQVINSLAIKGHQIYIFGGTEEEARIAEKWGAQNPNIHSQVKKMTLSEELNFISTLDVMLSMDSAGMHLASLKGVPVMSIWGPTHPYAGFLGYRQSIEDTIQVDLYCRPCSVYGNVPCYRGDLACMNNLSPATVVDKILNKLKND